MNNEQNNNNNPQLEMLNNLNSIPIQGQNGVIPNQQVENQNKSIPIEPIPNQNTFIPNDPIQNKNTTIPNEPVPSNNITPSQEPVVNQNNQFINQETNYGETALNDLNVDGTYNRIKKDEPPSYVNDPQVRENMNPKKNTVTITKELKTVIIIAIVLLVFIFVMPVLFDLIRNVRFN